MASRVSCVSDTVLIIDGHSMAFRAFYALPADNFVTATGQHTNAVYGFVSMLTRLLQTERPTHVAVAFDVSRHSFRTEEYPEYKGTRDATPEEFKGQVELIREVLDAMGIVSLSREGFEADDILATLAYRAGHEGATVLVVSGDRDSFQTVTDNVTVLYPGATPGDLRRMTPAAVEAKYGVPPQRYPEIAAIVGETSDNLPGVPGVGPKTAAQWINKYDGLDNLLARADEIGGKRGAALREHMDDVIRNRRLNRLLTDMDLEVGPADLARRPTNLAAVDRLFDSLEFAHLRAKVREVSGIGMRDRPIVEAVESSASEAQIEVHLADASCDITAWTSARAPLALLIEGDVRPTRGDVSRLVLAGTNDALVVDPAELSPAQERAVADVLAQASSLIVHDAKGTRHALAARGWTLGEVGFDTMLAAYLAHPDQRSHKLEDVVSRVLGLVLEEETRAADALFDMDEIGAGPSAAQVRAGRLAAALHPLAHKLRAILNERGEMSLLVDMEMPLSILLEEMETIGIAADTDILDGLSTELGKAVDAAREGAWMAAGREVNLSSPKQLQEILFDHFGLPKTKKTKTGYTTNADALADLWAKTEERGGAGHDFLGFLLTHRDRIKLKQMVDSLSATIASDSRIHSTFSQVAAATGRLASSDPNLQNIPARSADGMRIRGAFVAGEGFESLMSADYSQIEMRLMAHLSGDEALIEAFNSGEDLHRTMASMVFGTPVADVTGEERSRIKATSYGLAYGLSSYGLAAQLGIPVPEAAALRERYFERFGKVRDYLEGLVTQARADGYTQTMFGRRRYLPDLRSTNRQRREMAERAALNAPIQGSAADIVKIAMLDVASALCEAGLASRLLVQIHDELLLEVAPGEEKAVEELVRAKMASPVTLSVPLDVAVGIGASWQLAAH
ncbi:DNA polymerase I [Actinomyces bouchesdurhonensis]|uniref:DNA polymerase I n=1 Tax=Actinomyces bouchesdurhonensis TaxID=1852361 RepID=UPI000AE29B71|nr:DNA polymerase I [Actinomyces bouchesdurhonensis]